MSRLFFKGSRPIKKFRVHRNKDGGVLVVAARDAKDKSYAKGDAILGFKTEEEIVVAFMDGGAQHKAMASYFNMLDSHIAGTITDKDFAVHCANIVAGLVTNFHETWEVFEKAGDLEPYSKQDRRRHAHARKTHARISKGKL